MNARVRSRGRNAAMVGFGIASVVLLAYLDWVTHRQPAVAIVVGGLAVAAIVRWPSIVEAAGLRAAIDQIPPVARPVIAAAPSVVYFLARGQGTSGAGGVVLVALALVVGVGAIFGRQIDRRLAGFYAARNRVLPAPIRLAAALVLPVMVAFLVIHGSLGDLPALFGGTTNSPRTPDGREAWFLLGTLLSAAIAYLLVRDAAKEETATSPSVAVPPTGWVAGHAIPPEGLPAWGVPDPSTPVAARLPGGLAVQVVETAGDWARVVAENGWTGWVDGRRLVGVAR